MKRWGLGFRCVLSMTLAASALAASGAPATEALRDFAQPALRDFTAKGVLVEKNDAELRKIGRNFAQAYRFHESLLRYKEPRKLRLEAKAGFFSVLYIINGGRKITVVPGLHIHVEKDITRRPGEQQGMLDSGVLTPAFFTNAVASRFVGQRSLDGRMVPVFEFWYTTDVQSRHHLLWLDPEKRIILRHDVDDRHGKPWVRYLFKRPRLMAGVWVPTRVEVYTADGRLAAATRYTDVKVNTGLNDALFRP